MSQQDLQQALVDLGFTPLDQQYPDQDVLEALARVMATDAYRNLIAARSTGQVPDAEYTERFSALLNADQTASPA